MTEKSTDTPKSAAKSATQTGSDSEIVADPPAGVDPAATEDAPVAETTEETPVEDPSAYRIKSRREEEDEQHARREAGNAEVEAQQAAARKNPW